ncbi:MULTISPECIES: GNAT family N-acetyltransferase [Idiomarina]|uniref:GNAT family N-acetyltransferase n=1 Tax=Idiomarina TaxID=135575 RepID=UPI00129C9354|nr:MULTISPECIES: GNAT family N-acetyltransferase [Idiomarina]MRJ42975.1 GNAT family N-acetyltransferase [Idiomarina sp. FeN1]NCU58527.1 GNAT family N-acetyltransferase [Idiomarina sp. FenA--70]NCU61224.1 GNAT family N-acetyltransferase [Idiomarina sp. FenBw--71]UUN12724.1 GNAT family N-acetyltransferase [Idiomarina loihiensis]
MITTRLEPFSDARDGDLAYTLFADQKQQEFSRLLSPPAILEQLLRSQYDIREQSYSVSYHDYQKLTATLDSQPIGILRIGQAQITGCLRLVDIIIDQRYRCRGVGTQVLEHFIDLARAKSLDADLHVQKDNPALRLYQRLGFCICGETDLHWYLKKLL